MVSTSDDGIMTEYLVKYAALRSTGQDRPTNLLKTLYVTDCYRAGEELKSAQAKYDTAMWNGVSSAEIDARLEDLSRFMASLARERGAMWGLPQ